MTDPAERLAALAARRAEASAGAAPAAPAVPAGTNSTGPSKRPLAQSAANNARVVVGVLACAGFAGIAASMGPLVLRPEGSVALSAPVVDLATTSSPVSAAPLAAPAVTIVPNYVYVDANGNPLSQDQVAALLTPTTAAPIVTVPAASADPAPAATAAPAPPPTAAPATTAAPAPPPTAVPATTVAPATTAAPAPPPTAAPAPPTTAASG